MKSAAFTFILLIFTMNLHQFVHFRQRY